MVVLLRKLEIMCLKMKKKNERASEEAAKMNDPLVLASVPIQGKATIGPGLSHGPLVSAFISRRRRV